MTHKSETLSGPVYVIDYTTGTERRYFKPQEPEIILCEAREDCIMIEKINLENK